MDDAIHDAFPVLYCRTCIYFSAKADFPNNISRCKRLDHKKLKFAKPYFKSYDCGMFNARICRDYHPNFNLIPALAKYWTCTDDYVGYIPSANTVDLVQDSNFDVRYAVPYADFYNGTHINKDGSLKWVEKTYYKVNRKSPIGYELIHERNTEV